MSRRCCTVLLLLPLTGGCSDVVECKVSFVGSGSPGTTCSATVDGKPRPVNSLMVEVYSLPLADERPQSCSPCVLNSLGCSLLDRRCLCGGDRPTEPNELQAALSGTRLGVDAAAQYCVRVVGLEIDDEVERSACECPMLTSAVLPEVPCEPAGPEPCPPPPLPPIPGQEQQTRVRLCALTEQPVAPADSVELKVRCLDELLAQPLQCIDPGALGNPVVPPPPAPLPD